jgi:hypothetical protein
MSKPSKASYRLQEALDEWNDKYKLNLSEADILAYAQEGRLELSFTIFEERVELYFNGRQSVHEYTGYVPLEPRLIFEIRDRQYCDIREVTLSDGGLLKLSSEGGVRVGVQQLYISDEELVGFGEKELASLAPGAVASQWPWGAHETDLLRHLAAAGKKFWQDYDPDNHTKAPTNDQVIKWLVRQGVSSRNAEVMATILRANGVPPGPRKLVPRTQ